MLALLEQRQRHPSWGGKKPLTVIGQRHPGWALPHRSTVCELLSRHGLVPKKRRRRTLSPPGCPSDVVLAPNDLWCANFKGQFKTGDGVYCYPLTVTDAYSLYLLGCQGLHSTKVGEAKPAFTRLMAEVNSRRMHSRCWSRSPRESFPPGCADFPLSRPCDRGSRKGSGEPDLADGSCQHRLGGSIRDRRQHRAGN